MNERFSVYLDAVRWGAAIIVLLSHFAYPRFTDGSYIIIRDLNLGSDAVILFFVLSGLVIAYTTEVKDKDLKTYSWHRATRLYSVVLPAILLTVLFDQIGAALNPAAYDGWWYHDAPVREQLLRALTFSNEWALQGFRVGTNGPYWSLSYEAAYYILFALAFYFRGVNRILLILIAALLFGPAVMALFPVWLTGVWAYRIIRKDLTQSHKRGRRKAWLWTLLPVVLYGLCLWGQIPALLKYFQLQVFGSVFVHDILRFSDEFTWNIIIGMLTAVHLVGAARLLRAKDKMDNERLKRFIRWGAGASFSLYVVHYPALQLVDAIIPETTHAWIRDPALLGTVIIICFAFAAITERRLKQMRTGLQRAFTHRE